MPAAPVVAPMAADDMSGSVGLGVGVVAGSTGTGSILVAPDTGNLMLKYWINDAFALLPRLSFGVSKTDADDSTSWSFAPEVLASFTMLKGASTRLEGGVGIGFGLSQPAGADTDTTIGIHLPIELAVEHFFTRWFSMGVAIHENFLSYSKTGDVYTLGVMLNSMSYMGSLFFYTD